MAWRKIEILSSAARTATVNSAKIFTPNVENVIIFVDVTVVPGSAPSTTIDIMVDSPWPSSSPQADQFSILTSAAIVAVGNTILYAGPGIEAAANVATSKPVPAEWSVKATHGNANSMTYSISAWIYERP